MVRRILACVLATLFVGTSSILANENMLNPEILSIQEEKLENGLQILMLEDHSTPLISIQVWYHTGSRNESAGITGISHMTEHMMFRGSTKYDPEEHNDIVKRNGGTLNAFTSEDMTVYFEDIASDKLELVIHLEAERMANLKFDPELIETERQVVAEERLVRTDNSLFGSALEQLNSNAYTAHPYNWPVIGWMSDIMSYTKADFEKYYRTNYAPSNATVVLVGDFKPKEAMKYFQKYFGDIPKQELPEKVRTKEPKQKGERRAEYFREAQLPFLLAAYHIPEASHKDLPALEVAQKILSDGKSSRIYKKCVYEDRLAMFAGGFVDARVDPGLFKAYIGVNNGVPIEDAEASLFAVIDSLAAYPPSDHELQKAKNQLEADFIFGLQTVSGKGMAIGDAVIKNHGDYNAFLRAPEELNAVTAEDVQRVMKEYFDKRNRTVVIVYPDNATSMSQ